MPVPDAHAVRPPFVFHENAANRQIRPVTDDQIRNGQSLLGTDKKASQRLGGPHHPFLIRRADIDFTAMHFQFIVVMLDSFWNTFQIKILRRADAGVHDIAFLIRNDLHAGCRQYGTNRLPLQRKHIVSDKTNVIRQLAHAFQLLDFLRLWIKL